MMLYKSAQKAMALPFNVRPRESGGDQVDQDMTDTQAKNEEQLQPDLKYLGEGAEGIAFTASGRVIKYITDKNGANMYRKALVHPCPCVVSVYDVREVQPSQKRTIYAIVMEKLQLLSLNEQALISAISSIIETHYFYYTVQQSFNKNAPKQPYKPQSIDAIIAKLSQPNYLHEELTKLLPKMHTFIEKAQNMCLCLIQNGFGIEDVHGGNVGRDKLGNMKLFDLGGSWLTITSSNLSKQIKQSGLSGPIWVRFKDQDTAHIEHYPPDFVNRHKGITQCGKDIPAESFWYWRERDMPKSVSWTKCPVCKRHLIDNVHNAGKLNWLQKLSLSY